MPGSWPPEEFPNLSAQNHVVTSPRTRKYNCIAWAAGNNTRKWWPDPFGIGYWPSGAPRQQTIQAFIQAFGTLGYVVCADGTLEAGVEKVAIYSKLIVIGLEVPTHAALQLPDGRWTSKLGDFEDIAHEGLAGVEGPTYGSATVYLSRRRS